MALTKIESAGAEAGAGAVSTPPKTIAARVYNGNLVLMYTVPAGRKWVGYVGSYQSYQYWYFVTPAGQTVNNGTTSVQKYSSYFMRGESNNSYAGSDRPITLHAGDMIHTGNQSSNINMMLLGEETDV